jgi:large conductance mechanosensitive channel
MGFFKEFKDFAMRGNVVDLAVGVVIGAAFGKISASLVSDIIMPPIGAYLQGEQFSKMALTLVKAVGDKPAVTINYGLFLQSVIDFLIIAFVVFLLIKTINKITRKAEDDVANDPAPPAPEPVPSNEEKLLTEIRDLLKRQA